jgi:hypothetical protein
VYRHGSDRYGSPQSFGQGASCECLQALKNSCSISLPQITTLLPPTPSNQRIILRLTLMLLNKRRHHRLTWQTVATVSERIHPCQLVSMQQITHPTTLHSPHPHLNMTVVIR